MSRKKKPEREPTQGARGLSLLPIITILLGVMAAVQIFLFFLHAYRAITFPYQLDYGEGPILQLAVRVARGQPLYPPVDQPPYAVASYVPLYYLLSALGVIVAGPGFLFGRLLSCLAAVAIAVCVGVVVWSRTRHRFASYLAASLILAMPHYLVWSALMRVDMLALAFSVLGFCLFARGRRAAGIPLFSLGVFTRRTSVAALGAAFLGDAADRGWRPALRAFAVQALLIVLLIGGAVLVTRGGLYRQLYLHTAGSVGRSWTWEQLWSLIWYPLRVWPIYFVITAVGAAYCLLARRHRVLLLYFAAALVIFLTGGRIGSAHNYLLEPTAVGAMMFGVMWAELSRRPGLSRPLVMALGGAIALQMVWTDGHLSYTISLVQPEAVGSASRYVTDRLREAPGPVLCEDTGLIVLAGKEPPLMPFEFTQMARAGALDPAPLSDRVRRGEFSLIVLRFNPLDPHEVELHRPGQDWKAGRWPEGIIAGVTQSYRLEQEIRPYFIFVPE